MTEPLEFFRELMRTAPFQPATNLWRAVELAAVQQHGLPGGRGLDLGCGDGKLTVIIDAATAPTTPRRWIGVDIDPQETAQARSTGLYATVHTGSAQDIREAPGSMDFVFSNSVLEHIESIDEVLAEAARLLKPGGRFIATVPGPGFHLALRGPLGPTPREDYLREVDERCAHLRYWSATEWRQQLARHGLRLDSAVGYLSPALARRWELLSNMTGGMLYKVFRGRSRPIEIQRRLGLRQGRAGIPGRLGEWAVPALAWGCALNAAPLDPEISAGLLVDAVKA